MAKREEKLTRIASDSHPHELGIHLSQSLDDRKSPVDSTYNGDPMSRLAKTLPDPDPAQLSRQENRVNGDLFETSR